MSLIHEMVRTTTSWVSVVTGEGGSISHVSEGDFSIDLSPSITSHFRGKQESDIEGHTDISSIISFGLRNTTLHRTTLSYVLYPPELGVKFRGGKLLLSLPGRKKERKKKSVPE